MNSLSTTASETPNCQGVQQSLEFTADMTKIYFDLKLSLCTLHFISALDCTQVARKKTDNPSQ